jgi:hypothetical protein
MVFNATFNNISVLSLRSDLLVEETGGPGENHPPVESHWQTLSHNVIHLALIQIRTHYISVIGTDCIGSCKYIYHTITATTVPLKYPNIYINQNINLRIIDNFSKNTTYSGLLTFKVQSAKKVSLVMYFHIFFCSDSFPNCTKCRYFWLWNRWNVGLVWPFVFHWSYN